MAIYREAIQKLIPPGPNDPRLDVVVGSVGHVAVSEASSLYNWFKDLSGGVESHFYIRYDGTVEQYRDTAYEADAQAAGNSWLMGAQRYGYVSYETEGLGEGKWTDAQLTSIKAIIRWVNETHGSPWQKTPAYRGRGHGYHSQFPEWNPDKHSCPGPARITQFNSIIVPWLLDNGKEVNVPLSDEDVAKIVSGLLSADRIANPSTDPANVKNNPTWGVGTALGFTLRYAYGAKLQSDANAKAIGALNSAVLAIGQKLDALPADVIEALGKDYEAHVELTPKDTTP